MIKKYLSLLLLICQVFIPVIAYADDDTPIIEDFEAYEVGVIGDKVGIYNWNDFSFTLYNGDKAEIIEEENGNKALKITKGSTDKYLNVTYNFDKINSGVAGVSFDFKAVHHSKWFMHLGTLLNEKGEDVGKISTYSGDLYVTNNTAAKNAIQYGTLSNPTAYANIAHIMDFANKTHTYKPSYVNASTGNTSSVTREEASSAKNIKSLAWQIKCSGNAPGWQGGAKATADNPNNDGIYYIDNIKIQKYTLKTEGTVLSNNDISLKPTAEISFNADIKESTVTDASLLLKRGDDTVPIDFSVSGKKVSVTPKEPLEYDIEYKLIATTAVQASGYAPLSEDYVYSFKTESAIPVYSDLNEGGRYAEGFTPELPERAGISYTYEANGGSYAKGTAFNDKESVSLKITAVNSAIGKSQIKIINFAIIGEISPEADNVKITGDRTIGSVLSGSYDFIDLNGDREGESIFKWYRSKNESGPYTQIENASERNYKLTSDDEDCYIKFGVVPVSQKEPNDYKEYLSEAFMSEFNPTATDIKISGTTATGNILIGSYNYNDLNGDTENGSEFFWCISNTENGEYKKIKNATEKTYKLTADDEDCYIKFGVIPKNNGTGLQNKEFLSEPLKGAFKPVVTDVKVTGTLKSGNSVGASYSYYDENGDEKEGCIVEWYVGGILKATGENYKITSSDSGKSLYISVTPMAENEPKKGIPVKSQTYKIASASNGSSYTGSSKGGSFTASKKNDNANTEVSKKEEPIGNDEKIIFSDIENHWAKEIILSMYEKGIINGKGEKLFMPDGEITRAEFASIIARLYNLEAGENVFNDVSDEDWFKDAVTAVYKAGYMLGDNGCFRPNDKITREEICVVIKNILKLEARDTENSFTDASEISDWARGAVYATQELGIVKGDNGFFKPKSFATRAEATVMLERMTETEVK